LAETYDRCASIVGIVDSNGNVLLPANHMAMNSNLSVTINGNGEFLRAEASKLNIVIPCTEESSQRTYGKAPHPLHEQIGYLATDAEKRKMYMELLQEWKDGNSKVQAVEKYLSKDTLISDLKDSSIEIDETKIDKCFIRFSVEVSGDMTPHLWEDSSVSNAWQLFCNSTVNKQTTIDYVTGRQAQRRESHPKGVNPSTNGAKLISCNDQTNYTYRGRFRKPEEANSIGFDTSHKAHAMLRYLITTQGYRCAEQAIVAWAIDDASSLPDPFANSLGIYANALQTDVDKLITAQGSIATDYSFKMREALKGKGDALELNSVVRRVAVLATDAATTGRMSVTFYQDMPENEYIERIISWHESCKWHFRYKGKDYVSSPSADKITAAVFGEPNGENYNKIKKQMRERILHCIVGGERIDRAWVTAALRCSSSPFSYTNRDGKWDKYKWDTTISTTCALARKLYYEQDKEVFVLELETKRADRDYLYGRLLAIADKIESHAMYLQGNNDKKRPTNANRYMQRLAVKPFSTWGLLYAQQLPPYLMMLNGAGWYQRQIDEIMSLFASGDFESDKPLSAKFLLGYSLQRRALWSNTVEEEKSHGSDKKD
jgi:CRISPR-associated protein Csd1